MNLFNFGMKMQVRVDISWYSLYIETFMRIKIQGETNECGLRVRGGETNIKTLVCV